MTQIAFEAERETETERPAGTFTYQATFEVAEETVSGLSRSRQLALKLLDAPMAQLGLGLPSRRLTVGEILAFPAPVTALSRIRHPQLGAMSRAFQAHGLQRPLAVITVVNAGDELETYTLIGDGAVPVLSGPDGLISPLLDRAEYAAFLAKLDRTARLLRRAAQDACRCYDGEPAPAERTFMNTVLRARLEELGIPVIVSGGRAGGPLGQRTKYRWQKVRLLDWLQCAEGVSWARFWATLEHLHTVFTACAQFARDLIYRRNSPGYPLITEAQATGNYSARVGTFSEAMEQSFQPSRGLSERWLLRGLWKELEEVAAPERYARDGVLLTRKLRGMRTKGFGPVLTDLVQQFSVVGSTGHVSLTMAIRSAMKVYSRETLTDLYRDGRVSEMGLIDASVRLSLGVKGEAGRNSLYVLRDLYYVARGIRDAEVSAAFVKALEAVSDKDLLAVPGGSLRETESVLNGLRYLVEQAAGGTLFSEFYSNACQRLGVPVEALSGKLCAVTPDVWAQRLTVQGQTFTFMPCASVRDLELESRQMHHCVGYGGYTNGAISGQSPIVSVRREGGRPADGFTVQLDAQNRVQQAYSAYNAVLTEVQREALEAWLGVIQAGGETTAPELTSRFRQMGAESETERIAALQAQARLEAAALVEARLEPAELEGRRMVRRVMQAFMDRVSRSMLRALSDCASLLGENVGLRLDDFESPGERILTVGDVREFGAVTLFDTPHGPSVQGVMTRLELTDVGGAFGWVETGTKTRIHDGGFRMRRQNMSNRAMYRRVHYTGGELGVMLLPPSETRMFNAFFGTFDQPSALDLSFLRPAKLPRSARERAALAQVWSERKVQLGLSVSERGALVCGGTELHLPYSVVQEVDFRPEQELGALFRGESVDLTRFVSARGSQGPALVADAVAQELAC